LSFIYVILYRHTNKNDGLPFLTDTLKWVQGHHSIMSSLFDFIPMFHVVLWASAYLRENGQHFPSTRILK